MNAACEDSPGENIEVCEDSPGENIAVCDDSPGENNEVSSLNFEAALRYEWS